MKIVQKKISDIIPYENNTKEHSTQQIKLIAESIEEFGFKTPMLLDKNNVIIQGHGRRLACIDLGIKEVPCIVADDLTQNQIKALRIADNKVAESGWLKSELEQEINELEEYLQNGFIGFSLDEIDEIIADNSIFDDNDENFIADEKVIPDMERKLNEHNDYIVFVFRNSLDFVRICEEFKLQKVNASLSPKVKKIGLGRVIDGKELIRKIDAKKNNT